MDKIYEAYTTTINEGAPKVQYMIEPKQVDGTPVTVTTPDDEKKEFKGRSAHREAETWIKSHYGKKNRIDPEDVKIKWNRGSYWYNVKGYRI